MNITTRLVGIATCSLVLLLGPFSAAWAQDCTQNDPCTMTLYVLPGDESLHLKYGDTLVLSFDGNNTKLIPHVADWETNDINLKRTEIWQPGSLPGEGRIVLAWEFKFKTNVSGHQPSDKDHLRAHLYKNPDSDEPTWILDNAVHSDGTVHGGTAHMTQ